MKYCYLVFCNVNPIIYGVYSNKMAALKYAKYLIEYRRNRAAEKNQSFGFYHYLEEDKRKETDFEKHNEKIIFSTCLKIDDGGGEFSENGTLVKVVRKPLLSKFA